jgi:acyl-CoA synthetase (AMP-forming)/AMP-acid ligase II/acyl carrier protein/surface polysaccharide O-acyltransferase-like enzyme
MIAPVTTITLIDDLLYRHAGDDSVVLVDRGRPVDRSDLIDRVARRAAEFDLDRRSVVVLSGGNTVEWIVTYLAALDAGHVPLLAGSHAERLASAWSAVLVHVGADGVDIDRRRSTPTEVHPELALLLSTSGSTGSPKLVRLSHRNLISNASAIAEYLGVTVLDRGITSLPLHYCYGLSVLHSHLSAGASIVVTDNSVVDPCFRAQMREHGVTNLAGVPHTYDMLERGSPDDLRVPSLRFLTQAGGRMDPAAVTRWTERARRWGTDFYVMYGQTEAAARIAYLPPAMAARRPDAIGVPIPGGALEVRPVPGLPDDIGELVYRGSNVMLGYAEQPADLAVGATLDELHTGDLARFHEADGVFEVVGRRSRFVKPFGLRIDLDVVERELGRANRPPAEYRDVAVAGDDERLVVVAPGADATAVTRDVEVLTGLPPSRIVVDVTVEIPRTRAGKVDYGTIAAIGPRASPAASGTASAASIIAEVLGRGDVGPDDSFVSLGGDSLSYVECSIRLEAALGRLPQDWHLMTVAALSAVSLPSRRRLARIDTTVLLRALGICLVVSTHMGVWYFPGGAHLMLAVVGYNLARFMVPIESNVDRARAGMRTAARAAVPTIVWTAMLMILMNGYGVFTLLLVNNYAGPESHRGDDWHFWFIEVFVHLVLITTVLLSIPAVRRLERSRPYAFGLALLAGTLVLRLDWAQFGDWTNVRFRTHSVAWIFVLGWLVQRSSRWWQRLLTVGMCVALVPGFFHYAPREWFIVTALVVLVWFRDLPFPRWSVRPLGALAAASMWIYVTHFLFWPVMTDVFDRRPAYLATIGAGVLVSMAVDTAVAQSRPLVARLRTAWRDFCASDRGLHPDDRSRERRDPFVVT